MIDEEYIQFADGGSLVPYYLKDASYRQKPVLNVLESYNLDYKTYCRISGHRYYVSIPNESFVRFISANDFKRVKEKCISLNVVQRVQLSLNFC